MDAIDYLCALRFMSFSLGERRPSGTPFQPLLRHDLCYCNELRSPLNCAFAAERQSANCCVVSRHIG
jgi:hypothetical protein